MLGFKLARAAHIRLGRRGERLAAAFLRSRNYDIIVRDYRCDFGEIDIIARDGATFCFIEVKTRRSSSRSRPAEGLSEKQKFRIRRAATHYLAEIGMRDALRRFDLVELMLSGWDCTELRHWEMQF